MFISGKPPALVDITGTSAAIASSAGGLPEINIDGYSGYMSNVGDVDDMCKNALTILKDKPTHDGFKANALAQAKKFDISNIVPKYEKLYEGLL